MNIGITGYAQDDNCSHCGRALKHVILTSAGQFGSSCVVRMIKANKKRFGNNGKPSASMIVEFAKIQEYCSPDRQFRMGYQPYMFTFELSE